MLNQLEEASRKQCALLEARVVTLECELSDQRALHAVDVQVLCMAVVATALAAVTVAVAVWLLLSVAMAVVCVSECARCCCVHVSCCYCCCLHVAERVVPDPFTAFVCVRAP